MKGRFPGEIEKGKWQADISHDVEENRPCQLIVSHFTSRPSFFPFPSFQFICLTIFPSISFHQYLVTTSIGHTHTTKMSTLLLSTPPYLTTIHRRNTSSSFQCRFSSLSFPTLSHTRSRRRGDIISLRAFDSSSSDPKTTEEEKEGAAANGNQNVRIADEDYPSGEFEFEPITGWRSFLVKVKMLLAFPWERVRKGSVLTMKLRGQVSFSQHPICHYRFSHPPHV